MIKSILRYPGGKSRVAQKIISLIPPNIKEFREPMVGGGSVALVLKQIHPHIKVWINDLSYDLVCFWKTLRDYPDELIKELKRIKSVCKDGRRLFEEFSSQEGGSEFERAVRFFVLNRISFSGTTYSGGFSQEAFGRRFTILAQEGSAFHKVEMNCGIIYLMLMHRRAGSVRTYASGEGTALGEGGSSHLYRWERRSRTVA